MPMPLSEMVMVRAVLVEGDLDLQFVVVAVQGVVVDRLEAHSVLVVFILGSGHFFLMVIFGDCHSAVNAESAKRCLVELPVVATNGMRQ